MMFRIAPAWDGAAPFTVNGAHILVLINDTAQADAYSSQGVWR